MSENHVLNSNINVNDRKKNIDIMENENEHLKSNYYSVLDIEDDFQCDESSLAKFKEHVQKKNNNSQPSLSDELSQINNPLSSATCSPSPINNDASTRASLNTQNVNNQNKKQKIPPINIFDVETDELIDFIKKGLNINEFKIKQYDNIKKIHFF